MIHDHSGAVRKIADHLGLDATDDLVDGPYGSEQRNIPHCTAVSAALRPALHYDLFCHFALTRCLVATKAVVEKSSMEHIKDELKGKGSKAVIYRKGTSNRVAPLLGMWTVNDVLGAH